MPAPVALRRLPATIGLLFTLLAWITGCTSQQGFAAANPMGANNLAAAGCSADFTPIYAIQGSGMSTAITGTVTTQGVVVGDYEGPSPALRGFYLQDAIGDGNPSTSDGIFIFESSNADAVSLGDVVQVSGTAVEFQGQTQIGASAVTVCSTGATVAPAEVHLPVADPNDLERYEGMLVHFSQPLYVTGNYQLGRFGEVLLSAVDHPEQPTQKTLPGAGALAAQAQNKLNQIILDDASQMQNPDPIAFGRGGQPLSAANTLRAGDFASQITGVLTYTWAGNAASGNAYRLRPLNALGGGAPDFQSGNPRPAVPAGASAGLRVVEMNLLNYFNTFADNNPSTPGCFPSGADADCRGAESQAEFDRQWPKTVAAILATGGEVIGITEIENDGYDAASAIQDLVTKLNAASTPGQFAFINPDAAAGQDHVLGSDAIKVGLLYQPGKVTPAGQTAVLNTSAFINGGDSSPRNRAALAQAFKENASGRVFVASINHFKSKSSACDKPDSGDGQGNCSAVRTQAAHQLAAWLATAPTGVIHTSTLILGDLNSYAREDPITALSDDGYTNLVEHFQDPTKPTYSYNFDGQWGYLDHALGDANMLQQVTGAAEYHINADEPAVLDYTTNYKTAAQQASLYHADAYRAADHDPLVVTLDLTANRRPILSHPFPSQKAYTGETFSFSLPADLFYDPDPGDSITLSARLAGGAALPGWLHFDPLTGVFSGVPPLWAGSPVIEITATDTHGASASARFSLATWIRLRLPFIWAY